MADNVGNRLGERGVFDYLTEDGDFVRFSADRSVNLAVGNTLSQGGGRPGSVRTKYLTGRRILLQLQSDPTVRKDVVIASPANPLYTSVESQNVTINGVVWQTTGRIGESVSFLPNSTAEAPPA